MLSDDESGGGAAAGGLRCSEQQLPRLTRPEAAQRAVAGPRHLASDSIGRRA